jgi:two-component sensor histidine kinase
MLKEERNEITEKIKYNLVSNLFTFFFAGVTISMLFLLFSKEILIGPNAMAVALFACCLILLKVTKNYKLVSMIGSITALVILTYVFLFIRASQLLSPMWMIVNIVFSFFVINRYWGGVMLLLHFIVYYYFSAHVNLEKVVLPSQFSNYDFVSFMIQLTVVALSLGYILFEHTRAIRISEKQLKLVNTQLSEKNILIVQQNTEMTVMLKEIHHRVKNNLQIISSMLRLQAESQSDESRSTFFKEAIDRISAMALIHDKMYSSDSLSNFDLNKYISSLSDNLLSNYAVQNKPVLDIQVEKDRLHSKTIVPLAILMNELLLNSIKHAFVKQENPKIGICIKSTEDDFFTFDYNDNGEWKKDSVNKFGSEIIQAMTEQLDGEMLLCKDESGTHYRFKLKALE